MKIKEVLKQETNKVSDGMEKILTALIQPDFPVGNKRAIFNSISIIIDELEKIGEQIIKLPE
jgi:hypothetical protein